MDNKVGIYYAYWEDDWDADFIPYVEKVKRLGFDALEVNAGTIASMSKDGRSALRSTARDAGVALSCCVGLPDSADPASSDPSVRSAGVAELNRIAEAMTDCGIERLSGIIYSSWPGELESRGITKRQAWDWSVESMREAMKAAEDRGLTYHCEVVNRFEQFLLNTAEEAVAYVNEVGSPNCRILLDTFHMNIEEDSIAGALKTAGDLLGHLHIGENNRRPPGQGQIHWDTVIGGLREIEYSGWIVMEPFVTPGGEVGRDIKVNRELMRRADRDGEARKACAFVKNLLSGSAA